MATASGEFYNFRRLRPADINMPRFAVRRAQLRAAADQGHGWPMRMDFSGGRGGIGLRDLSDADPATPGPCTMDEGDVLVIWSLRLSGPLVR